MSLSKTGIPYGDFSWNPCGSGCSNVANCPTCWARAFAARGFSSCADCTAFRVHFHPERLVDVGKRRKPATILVQFTGDLFDRKRHAEQTYAVLNAAYQAPWHTYVFLTQRPDVAAEAVKAWMDTRGRKDLPDRWWFGATVKNPAGLRFAMEHLTQIPSDNLWLSCEPLEATLNFADYLTLYPQIRLVVLGADNTPGRPEVLGFIRDATRQVGAAQVERSTFHALSLVPSPSSLSIYVKQIWLWQCPNCQRYSEGVPDGRCVCGTATTEYRRALVKHLVDLPADLPADLAVQDLPWDLSAAKTKTTTEDTETTETKGGLF